MKRTLTLASIELLLEELEYDKIHSNESVSNSIGNYIFTRNTDSWELHRCHKKKGEVTNVEFLVKVSDNLYHEDTAVVMLAAITTK